MSRKTKVPDPTQTVEWFPIQQLVVDHNSCETYAVGVDLSSVRDLDIDLIYISFEGTLIRREVWEQIVEAAEKCIEAAEACCGA